MLALLIILTLLRGPGNTPSIVKIKRCQPLDWTLLALLIAAALALTVAAGLIQRYEDTLKRKVNFTFVTGEEPYTHGKAFKVAGISFFCAFVAVSLGSGPSLFFVTTLLQFNVAPLSASGTGMYLATFTTISSTVTAIIFK